MREYILRILVVSIGLIGPPLNADAESGEWSGSVAVESRGFPESPASPEESKAYVSLVASP